MRDDDGDGHRIGSGRRTCGFGVASGGEQAGQHLDAMLPQARPVRSRRGACGVGSASWAIKTTSRVSAPVRGHCAVRHRNLQDRARPSDRANVISNRLSDNSALHMPIRDTNPSNSLLQCSIITITGSNMNIYVRADPTSSWPMLISGLKFATSN